MHLSSHVPPQSIRVAKDIFGAAACWAEHAHRLGYTGAIRDCAPPFPGTSIWQTDRAFAPLLPAPDLPGPLPGTCLASPVPPDGTWRGGSCLIRLSCFPQCSRETCPASHPGPGDVFLLWFHHRALPLFNLATPRKAW